MQDRYTGDIGDFGKLGLLRQLASTGLSIGVNWYRTPDETHNSDGLYTGYLQKEQFRVCDPALWSVLGRIVSSGKREIAALEQCGVLAATYFGRLLDSSSGDKIARQAVRMDWHRQALQALHGCDIVFVDPDNGLMVPSAYGTAKSNKFVLPYELAEYYHAGASIIYYQHKARRPDEFYIVQHRQLVSSGAFPGATNLGLKFTKTSLRYYFCAIRPEHKQDILACVQQMRTYPWQYCFERII
jgi:hypothetical protein